MLICALWLTCFINLGVITVSLLFGHEQHYLLDPVVCVLLFCKAPTQKPGSGKLTTYSHGNLLSAKPFSTITIAKIVYNCHN